MTPIKVNCGNGGDYEFERDRHLWKLWIKQHITNTEPFVVKPAEEADKALVIFEAERYNTIFLLKAPEYISWRMVKE